MSLQRGAAASAAWRGFARNLIAGARLALFLPVRAFDFRVSVGHYAALVVAGLVFWLAGGLAQQGPSGSFDFAAFTAALAEIPLVLGACYLAARLFRIPQLTLAFAVLFAATDPFFEIVGVCLQFAAESGAAAPVAGAATGVLIAWSFAVVARTQFVLTGWRGLVSMQVFGIFAALLLMLVVLFPRNDLWSAQSEETELGAAATGIVDEEVFHAQGRLLTEQLTALRPQRARVDDLYFVGVAADGGQNTFTKELESIRRLLEGRFDTLGRSVMLVNNPDTLTRFPIASASNLRNALAHLGKVLDADNDILLLHIATHGSSDHRLVFDLPPLDLAQLTPTALARMLADSGIKWKVIVISACYSGGFVEPLKDANTLVMTAADATHTSFGCDYDSDYTWFSQALYDQALRETYSFTEAFERARRSVTERELGQGKEPSNPQIFVGDAIRGKLAALERRLAARPAPERQRTRTNSVSASDSRIVLVKGR